MSQQSFATPLSQVVLLIPKQALCLTTYSNLYQRETILGYDSLRVLNVYRQARQSKAYRLKPNRQSSGCASSTDAQDFLNDKKGRLHRNLEYLRLPEKIAPALLVVHGQL